MQRRHFLVATGSVLLAGTLGLEGARHLHTFDLKVFIQQLQSWQGKNIQSSGSWSPTEIFQHCAQSIAGSLQGYPMQRSALFQQTAGQFALHLFQAAGAMRHPLDEAIPGMPDLDPTQPVEQALAHLLSVLTDFLHSDTAQLQPHFAYGRLSKADYQAAHWLHIQQHLSELSVS